MAFSCRSAKLSNQLLLPPNFHEYNFSSMVKKESNPKNRLRLLAMANIKEGKTLKEISEVLKIHWKSIQTWLRKFRELGIDGLYVKTTRDKPSKLTKDIADWLVKFINKLSSSDIGGHITGKQLQCILFEQFGLNCCLKTVYNFLHHLNFSWISSRSKHPKSDKEAQENYKKISAAIKAVASN
jgi:transposase